MRHDVTEAIRFLESAATAPLRLNEEGDGVLYRDEVAPILTVRLFDVRSRLTFGRGQFVAYSL